MDDDELIKQTFGFHEENELWHASPQRIRKWLKEGVIPQIRADQRKRTAEEIFGELDNLLEDVSDSWTDNDVEEYQALKSRYLPEAKLSED